MSGDTRGDVVDTPVYLGIVIGHVASSTGGVSSLRDTIENHLLSRHPCR